MRAAGKKKKEGIKDRQQPAASASAVGPKGMVGSPVDMRATVYAADLVGEQEDLGGGGEVAAKAKRKLSV